MTKKDKIKRAIRNTILALLAIWAVWYLVLCYEAWDILNPLAMVLDLPDVSGIERMGRLCVVVILTLITGIYNFQVAFDTEEKKARRELVMNASDRTIVRTHKSGPDAVDIAMGVGAGIVGAGIVEDVIDGMTGD